MKNPYSVGANAACEAMFSTTSTELVETLLQSNKSGNTQLFAGSLSAMLEALGALRKAGADLGSGRDTQAAEFLRKGHATMQLELMNAAGDDLAWRMRAIANSLTDYRHWLKSATVTDNHRESAPAAAPVHVVSMPDRVRVQHVDRDKDGEITSTTTVQRDFAAA